MSRMWTSLIGVETMLIRGSVAQHHGVAERPVDIMGVDQSMSSLPGQFCAVSTCCRLDEPEQISLGCMSQISLNVPAWSATRTISRHAHHHNASLVLSHSWEYLAESTCVGDARPSAQFEQPIAIRSTVKREILLFVER